MMLNAVKKLVNAEIDSAIQEYEAFAEVVLQRCISKAPEQIKNNKALGRLP